MVEQISIGNTVITDHGPVALILRFKSENNGPFTHWIFNTYQLQNKKLMSVYKKTNIRLLGN